MQHKSNTTPAYRADLLDKLDAVKRSIEGYRATLTMLEYEKQRLEYILRGFDEHGPRRSPYG